VKCSSDIRSDARVTTRWKKLWAIGCSSSRSRFLVKTVGTQIGSSISQPHEPAEQNVVIELLHEQPLTANRAEQLQQLRPVQALRRNRWLAVPRVQRIELARHLSQDFIDNVRTARSG